MKFFPKTNSTNIFYDELSTLTQLANKLETDKGTADSSTLSWGKNWPYHFCMGYTLTYEKYMNQFRNKAVKLFEIGICDKRFPYASPKMWMSYFKNLDLYCVDNFWGSYLHEKKQDIKLLNEWGINFIYADQGNFCDWEEIKKECPSDFDFIIEDGSHWPNHMAVSLWQSRNMIKSGGYYFMEDLQNPTTARGKFKYDNSLLAEDLFLTQKNGIFNSHFLNDKQNSEVNTSFELVEMVLDKNNINYIVVFRKK
jgi:hypothetical protein